MKIQVNPNNYGDCPAGRVHQILFDRVLTCNIQCTYCVNGRSKKVIPMLAVRQIFNHITTKTLQIGCAMEPTTDKELQTVIDLGRPVCKSLILQTNGLTLGRVEGVDLLSVSIDTANPKTFKKLRGGSSLSKVARNIEPYPNVRILCVVTRENINELQDLVQWAIDHGIVSIWFRQVVSNDIRLKVSDEDFDRLRKELHGDIALHYFTDKEILSYHEEMDYR